MMSSKITIDRLCWGPSNSVIARASWSCAAWTSRSAVSAGAWARTGAASSTKSTTAAPLRIVIDAHLTGRPMLPEAQHLLGAVVVDEDGAVGAEGDRARPLHLGGGERGHGLPLLVEHLHRPLLVRDVRVAEGVHRRIHRLAEPGRPHRAQHLARLVEDAGALLLLVEA